jgi:hypothetical protein
MHPLMKAPDKGLTKEQMGDVKILCLYAGAVVNRLRQRKERMVTSVKNASGDAARRR